MLKKTRRARYIKCAIGRHGAAKSRHDPQGAAFSFPHEGQRIAKEIIVTSESHNLNNDLIEFLAGNGRAGAAVYPRLKGPLLRQVRRHAPDLPRDIAEDAVIEVFVLMMERRAIFDPARGSAQAFVTSTLLPESVRRIRAENARPGAPKRQRKQGGAGTFAPTLSLDDVPEHHGTGYGSPAAMEAVCDAHAIWLRATPPMRLIIGGLMDGETQSEIAEGVGMDRFRVARMITGLQRQFAAVA
jgi:hypothetical protein